MAKNIEDLNKNIENLKDTAKKSFSRIYASLKARELKTLRQLEVIQKEFQCNGETNRNCVQNIMISYDNESSLLDNISKYGAIDLEQLHFDNSTFTTEDYVSPNEDHMYSYKCIEDLKAIEEAALKQVTSTDGCCCFVNIRPEDVSKQFREDKPEPSSTVVLSIDESPKLTPDPCISTDNIIIDTKSTDPGIPTDDINMDSESTNSEESKKVEPTEDWLNTIKTQTETEPTQADCLEHSQIACS